MAELDLLTQIATDVKYLRLTIDEREKRLEAHIIHDEKTVEDYIKPLWEARQQQKGAAEMVAIVYTAVGGAIVAIIDYLLRTKT